MRRLWVGLVLLLASGVAAAAADIRAQEIAQCLPGEIQTWNDGRDHAAISTRILFIYDPAQTPPWFKAEEVQAAIARAAQAWEACGVETSVMRGSAAGQRGAGAVLVQWSDGGSQGNFGLANLGQRSLALGPTAFGLLNTRNPNYPAAQTLQMVISHEMGHFFGLMAHSRRCVDVMSYYTDGKGLRCQLRDERALKAVPEYRSTLPTACDIQRCRAVNGRSTQADGLRILNASPSSK